MRLLWSLPKAAPAILRHLVAYVELAAQDIEHSRTSLKERLVASVILIVCVFFLLLSACFMVLALTWDTPYRVAAVGWMGGVFLVAAFIAAYVCLKRGTNRLPFLSSVRREWAEDRVILEKILAEQE